LLRLGNIPKVIAAITATLIVILIVTGYLMVKEDEIKENKEPPTCKRDWKLCIDNSDFVNNLSGMGKIKAGCQRAANDATKYGDPEWPWLSFKLYKPGNDYVKTGVAVLTEKDARFQNGFGVKTKVVVTCTYNLIADMVRDVRVTPK
jgi:hypothetical protein